MKKGKPPKERDEGDDVWAGSQPRGVCVCVCADHWGPSQQQPGSPAFPISWRSLLLHCRPYEGPSLKDQRDGEFPEVGSILGNFLAQELEKDNNFLQKLIQILQKVLFHLIQMPTPISISPQSSLHHPSLRLWLYTQQDEGSLQVGKRGSPSPFPHWLVLCI